MLLADMRAWLFQANPARWRIFDYIRDNPDEMHADWNWSCWRFRDEISIGDACALWITGSPRVRGIHAVGHIVGEPYQAVEDSEYWTDAADRSRVRWFVDMLFEHWLLDEPVLAIDLKRDARFAAASILRTPRFANPHPLTDEQWAAVLDLLPDDAG